jgi:hypothetical protein
LNQEELARVVEASWWRSIAPELLSYPNHFFKVASDPKLVRGFRLGLSQNVVYMYVEKRSKTAFTNNDYSDLQLALVHPFRTLRRNCSQQAVDVGGLPHALIRKSRVEFADGLNSRGGINSSLHANPEGFCTGLAIALATQKSASEAIRRII